MNFAWSDPILTCAQAKALEAGLLGDDEGREWSAMQRAGAAVARAVLGDFQEIGGLPAAGRILVLVGKGHNGGDALLAAKAILERHPAASADVVFAFGERTLRPLAARAWRELQDGLGHRIRVHRVIQGENNDAKAYDLCLDGIFGFQFHPPVDAGAAELLQRINAHGGIRLRAAVDLPSGVGEESSDIAFRADFTYATGSVKRPLLVPENRERVGRLRYLDLGFFDAAGDGVSDLGPGSLSNAAVGRLRTTDGKEKSRGGALGDRHTDFVLKPSILAPLAALRPAQSDKRTYGHLFVIGGSRRYPGAALMCVRAALRSGVGLVTAFVPESLVPSFAALAPEAIWVGWPVSPAGGLAPGGLPLLRERLGSASALVMGSGLGSEPETLGLVAEIVKLANLPTALDASALEPSILAAARGRNDMVCLPHAGEFKRLADGRDANPAALRALATETGATVVLKGAVTRIAGHAVLQPAVETGIPEPCTAVYHSFFGGPVLARGGSGDVLAGLVGGLLAQTAAEANRHGSKGTSATLVAACRGVVWHGLAADMLARDRGQAAVSATQLLDYLSAALREASNLAAVDP